MSDIEFINTNTRTEVTMWYSIHGAPHIDKIGNLSNPSTIAPVSAKFIFVDGDFSQVFVQGYLVKKNGEVSERVVKVPGIYSFNHNDWPQWLRDLRDRALADFAADRDRR